MTSVSIGILILHAAILGFQFLAIRLFPRLRKAIWGTYLILLPVGFGVFAAPGPWLTLVLVLCGITYVLVAANRSINEAAGTMGKAESE